MLLTPSEPPSPTPTFPSPHADVNRVLLDLWARVSSLLGSDAVGMYLYGSLATGGFEPGRSDIDFVVLTETTLPAPQVEALEGMHMALLGEGEPWVKKLEGAYVPQPIIRRHDPAHPSVPILNEERFYLSPLDSAWSIQRRVIRETGVTIAGPPPHDLIDPVSDEEVREAIIGVLNDWWAPKLDDPSALQRPGYQPFAVQTMCRALHTVTTGKLGSKDEATAWAIDTLDPEWATLIENAHRWREGDDIDSIERTLKLMEMVIQKCHDLHREIRK